MPKTTVIAFYVFSLPFAAAGVIAFTYGMLSIRRSLLAKEWPTVEGAVTRCELTQLTLDGSETFSVDVSYSYAVDGVAYESKRIAFGYAGSGNCEFHERLRTRILETPVPLVRYDPTNPSTAVLANGFERSQLFLPLLGILVVLFVAGLDVLVWIYFFPSDGLIDSIKHK